MKSWNYNSSVKQSSGYEDTEIKQYTRELYLNVSEEEQKEIIDKVFNIYRSKNIFPIWYYNQQGIDSEIKKCIEKELSFDGEYLNFKFHQGTSLCRFMFPNLNEVDVRNNKNNSIHDRFYDNHKLKRAIAFSLKYNKDVTSPNLRRALEMIEHGIPQNFKPMNAKALYEKYVPENGVIYDFSAGYGGRMLGALTSNNTYKYIGVEPNSETFNNLLKLGDNIEGVTGNKQSYEIYNVGSEDFTYEENSIDFAFSSPPYFNLEKYSQEENQCYIKFPTLEKWFDGYVEPTIVNTYNMLKHGAYYAVNIADFKMGKNTIELVDKWVEIAEGVGFKYEKQISMKLEGRSGDGHNRKNGKEGIFIFKK